MKSRKVRNTGLSAIGVCECVCVSVFFFFSFFSFSFLQSEKVAFFLNNLSPTINFLSI